MKSFFFFRPQAAYEMRISDGSSVVCSSDLHNAVGNSHCLMHDPERASAAESREFQSRCRMPLGDIACHVHAAEKERRSAFSWTLQCRQAVAGLFETHQKILAKPVDVMAQADRKSVV